MSDASLVVSICSATIAGGSLVAQGVLYWFNGARLKVQLVFCYRTDWGLTMSSAGTSRKKISFQRMRAEHHVDLGIEYAKVRVTNIGRTPVSVENISFDLGHERWYRRQRSTVVPMQFVDPEDDSTKKKADLSPQRLEPGDNITKCFHLWPTLGNPDQFKHRWRHQLVVRGSAQAVGRRATRSRRRDAWRFRQGELSVFSDVAIPPPHIRVYRVLWQYSYSYKDRHEIEPVWYHHEVVRLLEEGKSHEEIRVYLDGVNTDPNTGEPKPFQTNHMVAYDAHHAFHNASAHSLWDEVLPPQRLSWRDRVHRVLWGQGRH